MKLLATAIANTLVLATILPLQAAESPIELTYSASQIQCGANAPRMVIGVDVYHNGELVAEDMRVNDSVLVPDLAGVTMDYYVVGEGCGLAAATERHVSKYSDVPNLAGYDAQDSISDILSGLESYEDLYLVELGTTNTNSSAYDLQDVVFIVNNEPDLPETPITELYAD